MSASTGFEKTAVSLQWVQDRLQSGTEKRLMKDNKVGLRPHRAKEEALDNVRQTFEPEMKRLPKADVESLLTEPKTKYRALQPKTRDWLKRSLRGIKKALPK